jgi:quinoprotein relay system zinc metallohydrolase 2
LLRYDNVMKLGRRALLRGLAASTTTQSILNAIAAESSTLSLAPIADGVLSFSSAYALMTEANQGAICNLGAIIGDEAVAVVDSGGSLMEARSFIAAIKTFTEKPIRYAINTHMHPDHVFGNAAFRDIGAKIVGHHNLPRALSDRQDFYLKRFRDLMGNAAMTGVEIVAPSLLVDDRLMLDLGQRKLELRAWKPAHTDNDLTVYDTNSRTLFGGDLVFTHHLPTLDGSLLGWMRQLDELAAIPAARIVPGHGAVSTAWPLDLDAERTYFEVLARDLRKSIADGQVISEAVKTAAQSERGKWELFDEYNERNALTAFAELEWE